MKLYLKTEKKPIIKLSDIEIEKQEIQQHKKLISIKNIDTNKIVVSNKISFGKKGFKYFIGYKDANKVITFIYISPKN